MNFLKVTCLVIGLGLSGYSSAIETTERSDANTPSYTTDRDSTTKIRLTKISNKEVFKIVLDKEHDYPTSVSFKDWKGNVVATAMFMEKKEHVMDLQGLSPGKYLVKIRSGRHQLTRTIEVENRGRKGSMDHYTH